MSSVQSNTAQTYYPLILKKNIAFRIVIFILLVFWFVGLLFPVLFASLNNKLIEFIIANLYSTVCHQQSEKCISIVGMQLLVCARCTGIYFGALLSAVIVLFFSVIRIDERTLLTSLLIVLADVLLVPLGVYNYSKTISFVAGLLFGASIYLYLIGEFEKFFFTSNKNAFQ